MRTKKPRTEVDRAIARLRREEQVSVASLVGSPLTFPDGHVIYPQAAQILRWGTQGMRGVFLDVLFCRRKLTWVTSEAAVSRFLAALAARQAG